VNGHVHHEVNSEAADYWLSTERYVGKSFMLELSSQISL